MRFIKRFNLWIAILFLFVSPLCQSAMIVFAETSNEQETYFKIHKNKKNQAVVTLPQINEEQVVTIKSITPIDVSALEEEATISDMHSNEEQRSVSFMYQGTAPFQLYFVVDQVKEQKIVVEQNDQVLSYQLYLDESFTKTTTTDTATENINETSQLSSETDSSEGTSETSISTETKASSEADSIATDDPKPQTTIESTEETTETARTKELRSSDLMSEISADRDAGWQVQLDKKTTLSTQLSSGNQVSYGFSSEADLFLTNIFLTDQSGQRVDYRNESNVSNNGGIRFYYFEKAGEYTPLENVALNSVSIKENQIRGYGELTLSHNLIYSYKVVVRVTLSSNAATGDVQKQIDIKRVDKPLLGDPQPMNIGFSEITDTNLNNSKSVDASYLGCGQGLSIANDSYQAMFKVAEQNSEEANPDKWSVAKGTYLDLSIGIHWWYRNGQPGDFFKSHSIISSEVHGLEDNNGQPGEVIDHYHDSAVAMMWNKQKVKPQETRQMSYTIHLDEINKPKITLQSDIPTSLLEGKNLDKINGTVESDRGNTINLMYAIDNDSYTTFEEVANKTKGEKQEWLLDQINLSAYKPGKHTLTILAQDSEGGISEKIVRTFRIISKDTKYVFDSTVTNTDGLLSKVHPGDRLHYEIYLENRGEIISFRWENEYSTYLNLDEKSIHIENNRDPQPDIQINNQKIIYDSAMAPNEVITVSFDAVVKEESLGVKLASIVNKASFYERGNYNKPLVKSEIHLANEGTVTNFPKPYLEGNLLNQTIKEEDELIFEEKLGNLALDKDVNSGSWKQVQYIFPEEEGITLNEIEVLDKNNHPLPEDQVECSIVSEGDTQQNQKSYHRMATARFKKDILPKEEYHIKVKATAKKDSSKLKNPITIQTSAFGTDKTEEAVETVEEIKLPKIQPKEILAITDVTNGLDFGEWTLKRETQKKYAEDLSIKIQDTRTAENSWTLQITGEIKNDSGDLLPLFFENQKQQRMPLEDGIVIKGKGAEELAFGHEMEQRIYAELSPSMNKGKYQGSISWNLMDVP